MRVRLSPHFVLSEFTRSNTAKKRGIDNTPTAYHIDNLRNLAVACELIRHKAGGKSIRITSGYRGDALNAAIGGAKGSYHRFGLAADLRCKHISIRDLARVCATIPLIDKVIYESLTGRNGRKRQWVHIQISKPGDTPRGEFYNAVDKTGGGVRYIRVESDFVTEV